MEDSLTLDDSYRITTDFRLASNILKHSENVAKVCYYIGKKLAKKGITINIRLLVFSALLHDLFKIIEVDEFNKYLTDEEVEEKKSRWLELKEKFSGKSHTQAFAQEFMDRLPNISRIINKHLYQDIHKGFEDWEEKILFYADKLVKHDKITSLKNRLDDSHRRYRHKEPYYRVDNFVVLTDKKILELESEILKTAGISSEELIRLNDVDLKELIKDDFRGEMI